MTKPEVSVIITTYNRAQHLELCLEALTCQSLQGPRFEVIVSDWGSTDETPQVVDAYRKRLPTLHWAREDLGGFQLARARNTGLKFVHSPVAVFIDVDTLLWAHALENYLRLYEENRFRAIGGYYKYLPPMHITPEDVCSNWAALWGGRLPPIEGALAEEWNPDYFTMRDPREAHRQEFLFDDDSRVHPLPFSLCGGNLMIPRAILDEVGWWEESFQSHGGEDAEMSLRIAMKYGFSYSKRVAGAHVAHPRKYVAQVGYDLAGKLQGMHPHWFTEGGEPIWTRPDFEPYPGRK